MYRQFGYNMELMINEDRIKVLKHANKHTKMIPSGFQNGEATNIIFLPEQKEQADNCIVSLSSNPKLF